MKRFYSIYDLQAYLSTIPVGSEELEVELSVGEYKLKETWVIAHHLIINGMTEDAREELSFPTAPHLHLVSYAKSHQTKIIGDVDKILIEIKSNVVFKNLFIQRGIDEDKEKNKENGTTILIAENASFKAYHCMINAFQHNDEYPKYQAIEVSEKAKAYLSHCKIQGNQQSHGILVRGQYSKRKYKYDLVLNHCQLSSHATGIHVQDEACIKISNSSIKHSTENGIYQHGALLELKQVKLIDSGHHALSLICGKAMIKGMFAKQINFSAISAYIKCSKEDIEKDISLDVENADLIVEDLEVYQAGESAIFLHENTRAIAKRLKAHEIDQVVFKSSASSQLYIEDAQVSECKGCSLAAIDLSEMIAKKVKLSAGDWGTIYVDSCAKLFLDDLIENVEASKIDLLGSAQLELGEHDEQMKSFLKQAYAKRVAWNEEKWLSIFKDRTNRFEINTRKRMAYLFKAFCKNHKDSKLKDHLCLEPYIGQWGVFGEAALYPHWIKIGSPNSITFTQEQAVSHRFECLKREITIQEHALLTEDIVGLSFANKTFFVFTKAHIYDYQIDEATDSLSFIRKRKLWGDFQPISDRHAYTLNVLSQNSKHYLIFEYDSKHSAKNTLLLIYDYIDSESKYYYLDRDMVGFYPKDDKIITFGWDSYGHPTDRCTWKSELTQPSSMKTAMSYVGETPQEPWLWHKYDRVLAYLKHEYQIEIVNFRLSIFTTQNPRRVYEMTQDHILYFTASDPYVLCASTHELFIIKKKDLLSDDHR